MQDILTCAMGLDIHRDVIVACLAKGELGTDPEIEIRSFSTLIPEMRKLRDWVLEAECRYVAMESTGIYRNVFSVTPRSKVKLVAKMLKAIHAQESKKAAREKAWAVVEELRSMKLKEAAKKVEDGTEETLTYCDFPSEHWTRIRTNNVIERLNREIRRRTRVVGSFPDGNSALMLVCARLRHVAGTQWGNNKYMNMKHLEAAVEDTSIAG